MLFGQTVAVYCEIRTEHTDTLRGQTVEFQYAKEKCEFSYQFMWLS
jgi:hypothetical protein